MSPKVSVIIPAYNSSRYIAKAITSALEQTLFDLEIIVVDDGSTDCTANVVRSFKDGRIILISNRENRGPGNARNRALHAAKGKWVAVLDSDDWYARERLKELMNLADAEKVDLIADDLHFIRDGEQCPYSTLIEESGQVFDQVTKIEAAYYVSSDIEGKRGLHLGFAKPMFRRDFLIKHSVRYNEAITVGEDFWLNMACFLHGARFFLVPCPYYYYRLRQGSLVTTPRVQRLEAELSATNEFLRNTAYLAANQDVLSALIRKKNAARRALAYYRMIAYCRDNDIGRAISLVRSSPECLIYLASQLPGLLSRRFKYYLLHDETAFDVRFR